MDKDEILQEKSELIQNYAEQGKMAYSIDYLKDFQIATSNPEKNSVFSGIMEDVFVVKTLREGGITCLELYTPIINQQTNQKQMIKVGETNEKGSLVLDEEYMLRLKETPLFEKFIEEKNYTTPNIREIEQEISERKEKEEINLDVNELEEQDDNLENVQEQEQDQEIGDNAEQDNNQEQQEEQEQEEIDVSRPDVQKQVARTNLSSNIRFSFNPNEKLLGETFNQIVNKNYIKVEAIPIKGAKYNIGLVGVLPNGDQELISELVEIDRNYDTYRMDSDGKIIKSNPKALYQVDGKDVVFNISDETGLPSLSAGKISRENEVLAEQVNTSNQRRPAAEQDRYFKTITSAELDSSIDRVQEQTEEGTTVYHNNIDNNTENDVLIDPYNEKIKDHQGNEKTLEEYWKDNYSEKIEFDEYLDTVIGAEGDCWPDKIENAHKELDAEFGKEEVDHGDRGERKAPWEENEEN